MADSALFIGFGQPVRGRERQAIEAFNEAIGYWSRLEQQGEIEGFDAVFLEPHGGDLGGFFLLRGARETLARIRVGDELQRVLTRAGLVVDSLGVVGASIGEGIAQAMGVYEQALSELQR